jgi:excisionase family DNA binding protein
MSVVQGSSEANQGPAEILLAVMDAASKMLRANKQPSAGEPEPREQIYTVREAAGLLRYKPSYIYELVKRGELASIRHGKYITIRDAAIRDFIVHNERRGA